jgi:hypothetical protein
MSFDNLKFNILPNSKMKNPVGARLHKSLNWVPIYCANCGKDGGFVPEENCNFAFWLCDPCYEKHGTIAGTMATPDDVFWAQVAQDSKEN